MQQLRARLSCLVLLFVALMVPVFSSGCGGAATAEISGTVKRDGEPLPAGRISFTVDGKGASGQIVNGAYTVKGVPIGQAKVSVTTNYIKRDAESTIKGIQNDPSARMRTPPPGAKLTPEQRQMFQKQSQEAMAAMKKAQEALKTYRPISARFMDPEKSGLTYEVKKGDNTFDVTVSAK